jgi:ubiquinone/menaquinone biosynthesis C-methylase UbiE
VAGQAYRRSACLKARAVLSAEIIQELHCPYCASPLTVERVIASMANHIEHGVVRCGCYRYPIIDGILILKQQSGPADTHDVRVAHLMAGAVELARHRAMHVDAPLLSGQGRWQRAIQSVAARGVPLVGALVRRKSGLVGEAEPKRDMPFAKLLETLRPGLYAQYLYQRYANNSFLASVAPLLLLGDLSPGQRILELTCGIGHSGFLIQALFPHLQLVATDHDFVNLSLARQHFVPNALLVCLDAEAPLPFAGQSFGAVFCLDGFHYLRSKAALTKELDRVSEHEALWLFPHLHNAQVETFNPGIPLLPDQYGRCFAQMPHKIFQESVLLRDFFREGALFLERVPATNEIAQAQNLTLVGTRRTDFWRARTDLAQRLSTNPAQLLVNPIYSVQSGESTTQLTLTWPSSRLRDECREVEDYLPNSCEIDSALLRRLRAGSLSADDSAIARDLTQKFILVNLPHAAYTRG